MASVASVAVGFWLRWLVWLLVVSVAFDFGGFCGLVLVCDHLLLRTGTSTDTLSRKRAQPVLISTMNPIAITLWEQATAELKPNSLGQGMTLEGHGLHYAEYIWLCSRKHGMQGLFWNAGLGATLL